MTTRWLRLIGILAIVLTLLPLSVAAAQPPEGKGNSDLQLRIFVHYPKPDADAAKGGGKPSGPVCTATTTDSNVYGDAGWRLVGDTPYYVNWATVPAGTEGAIAASFDTWATVSGAKLTFAYQDVPVNTNRAVYDGKNIVAWGSVPNNAIGVTYTWSRSGVVAEVDTIMNARLKWAWTAYSSDCAGMAGAYDVQDILTHELGHWLGLDDLYGAGEKDLTMYGYGVMGELKKDTLELGDRTATALWY